MPSRMSWRLLPALNLHGVFAAGRHIVASERTEVGPKHALAIDVACWQGRRSSPQAATSPDMSLWTTTTWNRSWICAPRCIQRPRCRTPDAGGNSLRFVAAAVSGRADGDEILCAAGLSVPIHQWYSSQLPGGRFGYRNDLIAGALGDRRLWNDPEPPVGRCAGAWQRVARSWRRIVRALPLRRARPDAGCEHGRLPRADGGGNARHRGGARCLPDHDSEPGAKCAGEAGTAGAAAAVATAVNDALAPSGVTVSEIPLTPEAILRVLQRI